MAVLRGTPSRQHFPAKTDRKATLEFVANVHDHIDISTVSLELIK